MNYLVNYDAGTATLATFLLILKFVFIFMIIVYVLNALKLSKLFKAMGVPTWKAWVPIYNSYTKITKAIPSEEIGFTIGLLFVLSLVPYVNWLTIGMLLAIEMIAMTMLAKGFNKNWKWVLKTQIPIVGFFVEWRTYSKGEYLHEVVNSDPLLGEK